MARKKLSSTVYLTHAQDQQLKRLSLRTRVPVAVYIREGVDLMLARYHDLIQPQHPEENHGREERDDAGVGRSGHD